jgi:type II secretory pathway component PulC
LVGVYFVAKSVVLYLTYEFFDVSVSKVKTEQKNDTKVVTRDLKGVNVYSIIPYRNIFNPEAVKARRNKPVDVEGGAVRSSLPLKLNYTIPHEVEKYSLASVFDSRSKDFGTFEIDEYLFGKAQLLRVKEDKIFIKNLLTSAVEYIAVEEKSQSKDLFFKRPNKSVRKTNTGGDWRTKISNGIRKTGKDSYKISKSMLDYYLGEGLPSIINQAWMKPKIGKDGKIEGFRVEWIKKNSKLGEMLKAVGIEKGDTIVRVGDRLTNNPAQLLRLMGDLKDGKDTNMVVNKKNGSKKRLNYNFDI